MLFSQQPESEYRSDEVIVESSVLSDSSLWKVEQQPGGKVVFGKNGLEIFDRAGATIWLKEMLRSPVMIQYNITVINNGGAFDRVSDMNVFFMASHPVFGDDLFNPKLKRDGKFSEYDSVSLYYVGCGGHDNTTTRYRRYDGSGSKPLLPGHDLTEQKYLLVGNKNYNIKIIVAGEKIQYFRNDEMIFDVTDPVPLKAGYFGFRTVNSHQKISGLTIYKLTH